MRPGKIWLWAVVPVLGLGGLFLSAARARTLTPATSEKRTEAPGAAAPHLSPETSRVSPVAQPVPVSPAGTPLQAEDAKLNDAINHFTESNLELLRQISRAVDHPRRAIAIRALANWHEAPEPLSRDAGLHLIALLAGEVDPGAREELVASIESYVDLAPRHLPHLRDVLRATFARETSLQNKGAIVRLLDLLGDPEAGRLQAQLAEIPEVGPTD